MRGLKLIKGIERRSFQRESRGRRERKRELASSHLCFVSLRNSISPYIVCNGLQLQESRGVLVMQVGKATPEDHRHSKAGVFKGPVRCRVNAEPLMVPTCHLGESDRVIAKVNPAVHAVREVDIEG